jgi:hypothetical protein
LVFVVGRDRDDHVFRSAAPTLGQAVAEFAGLVGFELEDG